MDDKRYQMNTMKWAAGELLQLYGKDNDIETVLFMERQYGEENIPEEIKKKITRFLLGDENSAMNLKADAAALLEVYGEDDDEKLVEFLRQRYGDDMISEEMKKKIDRISMGVDIAAPPTPTTPTPTRLSKRKQKQRSSMTMPLPKRPKRGSALEYLRILPRHKWTRQIGNVVDVLDVKTAASKKAIVFVNGEQQEGKIIESITGEIQYMYIEKYEQLNRRRSSPKYIHYKLVDINDERVLWRNTRNDKDVEWIVRKGAIDQAVT